MLNKKCKLKPVLIKYLQIFSTFKPLSGKRFFLPTLNHKKERQDDPDALFYGLKQRYLLVFFAFVLVLTGALFAFISI